MSATGSSSFSSYSIASAVLVLVAGEDLEEVDGAEVSLAQYREGRSVLHVLQVNTVGPAGEGFGRVHRVDADRRKWPVSMQQPIFWW